MKTNNQFDPAAHVYEDRSTTWSCVGKDVSECADAAQVLRESGLDFEVEKLPLTIPGGQQLEGRDDQAQQDPVRPVPDRQRLRGQV